MKKIIACFLALFCFVAVLKAQNAEKDEIIKINTTLVSVPVVVSDRQGRYVPGLKVEDFTILQDGKKQEIGFFATEEEPLNVAVMLDTSRSTEMVLDKIKAAAKNFIQILQPADRAMIVSFDYDIHVLSPLTSDRTTLEKAIKKVEVGETPGTVMRDAVEQIVEKDFANVKGRKAIILLTDGKDAGSYTDKSDLLNMLEESDVMLYSVLYQTSIEQILQRRRMGGMNRGGVFGGGMGRGRMGGNFPRGGRRDDRIRERQKEKNAEAEDYLQQMSELTAGRFYNKNVTDLQETFETIADELRKQYRLGFYPESDTDKTTSHEIKVKVARQDIAVRARATYRPAQ
ncbi:MAG: VWA domain-containing protein [Pyrinomonadaceae bacterium]